MTKTNSNTQTQTTYILTLTDHMQTVDQGSWNIDGGPLKECSTESRVVQEKKNTKHPGE